MFFGIWEFMMGNDGAIAKICKTGIQVYRRKPFSFPPSRAVQLGSNCVVHIWTEIGKYPASHVGQARRGFWRGTSRNEMVNVL